MVKPGTRQELVEHVLAVIAFDEEARDYLMTTRKVNSYIRLVSQTEELIGIYVEESDGKLSHADGQEIKKVQKWDQEYRERFMKGPDPTEIKETLTEEFWDSYRPSSSTNENISDIKIIPSVITERTGTEDMKNEWQDEPVILQIQANGKKGRWNKQKKVKASAKLKEPSTAHPSYCLKEKEPRVNAKVHSDITRKTKVSETLLYEKYEISPTEIPTSNFLEVNQVPLDIEPKNFNKYVETTKVEENEGEDLIKEFEPKFQEKSYVVEEMITYVGNDVFKNVKENKNLIGPN